MQNNERTYYVARGIFKIGLPVAVLMASLVALQRPGDVFHLQAFRLPVFLKALAWFGPMFMAAGYVWGISVYRMKSK